MFLTASIMLETMPLQCMIPGLFLRVSIFRIKMIKVGRRKPFVLFKSPCKLSKASTNGCITLTYYLTNSSSAGRKYVMPNSSNTSCNSLLLAFRDWFTLTNAP